MTFEDSINLIAASNISFRDEVVSVIRDRVNRLEHPEDYMQLKEGEGAKMTKDYVKRQYPKPGTVTHDPRRPYFVAKN